jgi:hypothetical protein
MINTKRQAMVYSDLSQSSRGRFAFYPVQNAVYLQTPLVTVTSNRITKQVNGTLFLSWNQPAKEHYANQ